MLTHGVSLSILLQSITLHNILDISISHDFLRVWEYFTIPSKSYKKNEAVVRLGDRERGEEQHQNKKLDKLEARRRGTLTGKL